MDKIHIDIIETSVLLVILRDLTVRLSACIHEEAAEPAKLVTEQLVVVKRELRRRGHPANISVDYTYE